MARAAAAPRDERRADCGGAGPSAVAEFNDAFPSVSSSHDEKPCKEDMRVAEPFGEPLLPDDHWAAAVTTTAPGDDPGELSGKTAKELSALPSSRRRRSQSAERVSTTSAASHASDPSQSLLDLLPPASCASSLSSSPGADGSNGLLSPAGGVGRHSREVTDDARESPTSGDAPQARDDHGNLSSPTALSEVANALQTAPASSAGGGSGRGRAAGASQRRAWGASAAKRDNAATSGTSKPSGSLSHGAFVVPAKLAANEEETENNLLSSVATQADWLSLEGDSMRGRGGAAYQGSDEPANNGASRASKNACGSLSTGAAAAASDRTALLAGENAAPSGPSTRRGNSLGSGSNGAATAGGSTGRRDPRASPFPGVKFCSSRNAWIARWSENGQEKWKTFPVRDSTFEEARRRALEFRQGKDRKKYERLWQQLSADAEGGGGPGKSPGPSARGGGTSPSGSARDPSGNATAGVEGFRSPAVSFSPGGSVRGSGSSSGGLGSPSGAVSQDIFSRLSPATYTGGPGLDEALENSRAAAAGLLFSDLQRHRWLEEALLGSGPDGSPAQLPPSTGKAGLDAALRDRFSRWPATGGGRLNGVDCGNGGIVEQSQGKKRSCAAAGLAGFSEFSGLLAGALEEAATGTTSPKKKSKMHRRELLDGLVLTGLDADLDRQNVPPCVGGPVDGLGEDAAEYLSADPTVNSLLGVGSLFQSSFPLACKRENRIAEIGMGLDRWQQTSRGSFLGDPGATEDACRNLLNAKALGMYKDALILILDDLLSHGISLLSPRGENGPSSMCGNGMAWRAKQKGAERPMRRVVEALRRRVADASVFRVVSPFIKLFEACILEKKVPSQFDARSQILYLNALSALYEVAIPA
ncbi:AP2 domain transcription factor AP2VIII-7 [Toxoplasma gondii CAST]|uniref:AP2 domain transcription factor AP2VIII-7 n=1 Tax=Toxoplasma gondii CAST TaxID=943122 RepID=A0A425I8D4_TOXGO|nr:AP2 domain transcription factor AP2VIII-7 [Toxoplasma gondii CAST]